MQTKGGGEKKDKEGRSLCKKEKKKRSSAVKVFNVSKHGDLLVLYFLLSPFLQHDVLQNIVLMLVKPFVLLFPNNLALEHGSDQHGDPLSDTAYEKAKQNSKITSFIRTLTCNADPHH